MVMMQLRKQGMIFVRLDEGNRFVENLLIGRLVPRDGCWINRGLVHHQRRRLLRRGWRQGGQCQAKTDQPMLVVR